MKIEIGFAGGKGILFLKNKAGERQAIRPESIFLIEEGAADNPKGSHVVFSFGTQLDFDYTYDEMVKNWLIALEGEPKPISLMGGD